jgi:hypothetical protein
MRLARSPLALLIAACLAGGLAACGEDQGGDAGTLRAKELQDDIAARLGAQTGSVPDVTCPGDLIAKQGNALRCRAEVDGQSFGITVTVTSTEGGSAQYELQVDPGAG